MKKKCFVWWGIAAMALVFITGVEAQRNVAILLKAGRYALSSTSYTMDLSRSDARGLRGTFADLAGRTWDIRHS